VKTTMLNMDVSRGFIRWVAF